MATTMLKIACCRGGSRLVSRSLCLSSTRFAQQAAEDSVSPETSHKPVTLEDAALVVESKAVDAAGPVVEESNLYPEVRGKYPPGSAEEGTGWEGMTSQEAWNWHKKRLDIEQYSVNVQKKISYLAKKPLKTWKFPSVQWGSGSLNYMGDRTKTYMITDNEDFLSASEYPTTEEKTKILAPILLDALRLDSKVHRSKLEDQFNNDRFRRPSQKYAAPVFENVKSHLRTKTILNTIISLAQTGLLGKVPHLANCALDENVKVSAQWARHGVQRHPPFKPSRKKTELPNNALFYGEHLVDFQLRTYLPLKEFYDREDPLCRECTYPKSPYKPTALGHRSESMQRPVCPGYHLGAPHQFTHFSVVHPDERHLARAVQDYGTEEKITTGYAMATSFFSTVATAHIHGFNMLSEITYPFCTQTIMTNGQSFVFSAYQLNTLHLWRSDEGNNRQNLFWCSKPHMLYNVDESGNIGSINEETLGKLLKVILLPTSTRKEGLSPLLMYRPAPGKSPMNIPHLPPRVKEVKDKSVY